MSEEGVTGTFFVLEIKMKGYPSIPREVQHSLNVYAFDKLDGSQIRAEWTQKNGFFKFGSIVLN